MRRSRSALIALCCVAAAATAATVRAQDVDPELTAKLMPGEMHKILAKYAGDWEVAVKFRMAPGEEMQDGHAACKAEMVLDGRHLRKVYESEMMGQPFFVHQQVGYDGLRGEFFEFTLESMSTGYTFVTGKMSADKKTITMDGRSPDPVSGKMQDFRVVYKLVSDDEYVVEWWQGASKGEMTNNVVLTHTRKKA